MKTRKSPFFKKYEVLETLGEGGFGRVVKARHQILGQVVAIKQLAPGLVSNEEDYERFVREAQAMARLEHPHIVKIFDADVEGGFPHIVMEFIEGRDVDRIVAEEGPLPVDEAVRLGREMATALAHMHEHGIIHRDVKTSNILRRASDGHYFLTDFGLVLQPDLSRITTTVMGSRVYMSPEQIDGKAVPASDQYSLGVVLFEALTGRPPFVLEGDHGSALVQFVQQVQHEPAPAVSQFRPEVPTWLDDLVARCLAKEPEDRFPDVQALERALIDGAAQPDASDETEPAEPETPQEPESVAVPIPDAPVEEEQVSPPVPRQQPVAAAPDRTPIPPDEEGREEDKATKTKGPARWVVLGLGALAVVVLLVLFTDRPEPGEAPPPGEVVASRTPAEPEQTDEDASTEADQAEEAPPASEDDPSEDDETGEGLDEEESEAEGVADADSADAPPASQDDTTNAEPLPEEDLVLPEEEEETASPPDLNLAEARNLADAFLNNAARNDTGHIASRYAAQVDYFDRGVVSRDAVVNDKRSYLERWPERKYERTSDVEIHKGPGGEVRIRFNYRYMVENSTRASTGEGWAQLTFKDDGGGLTIVGEKGGVYGSAERDAQ